MIPPALQTSTKGKSTKGASLIGILLLGTIIALATAGAGYYGYGYFTYRRAEEALARHRYEEAYRHYCSYLEIHPDSAEGHFEAARAARRANLYSDAAHHLARCRTLGWVEQEINLEKLLFMAQQGELEPNESMLWEWCQKNHPEKNLICEALAKGNLATYQLSKAVDYLNPIIHDDPTDAPALLMRGEAWERLRYLDKAQDDYESCLALDPEIVAARVRYGELLLSNHRGSEALPHFEWLHERMPHNNDYSRGYARSLKEAGRIAEAQGALEEILETHPQDFQALAELGGIHLAKGRPEYAEKLLRKAADLAPYEPGIIFCLAQCLDHNGNAAEAKTLRKRHEQIDKDLDRMRDLLRLMASRPKDPELRLEAGQIMIKNGQEAEGLRWVKSALRIDPEFKAAIQFLKDHGNPP